MTRASISYEPSAISHDSFSDNNIAVPTVAAATARALADAGIDRVFGLPGGEVLVLIDELRRAGVEFVLMRHEANAGLAAAVYGKLRRQPGVVLSTLGPGAANLMLPLSNAHLDQEPLLAISAQIPDDFPAAHTHQLLPLHDVYRPVTRYVDTITAQSVGFVVPRAIDACMTRPYGTAYLTLSTREALEKALTDTAPPSLPTEAAPSTAAAGDMVARLRGAARPLVAIGLGVDTRNALRIRRWLDAWNLPVVVTPKVKGIVDETSGNFVGVIGGMAADGLMCDVLAAADCLIGFGLDPVEIDKTWHAELPIHWILEAPNVGGLIPPRASLTDHTRLLDVLVAQPPPARWDAPFRDVQHKRRALLHNPSHARATMWPGDIVTALASALPAGTIVTTDVGSHKYLFGQFWPSRNPDTFWMSNGLSGMAYGLSAAIGAKLARPGAPVLAAVGDGGFSMNAQELETAKRVGAPFVTVVLEDGSYSLIKLSQQGKKLPRYGVEFGAIDTVKMAEACGVEALRTANPDELASAAKRAIERGRSLVIGVPVDDRDYEPLF
jgi:acetolactate synthase-1/2/3 large subunit